MAGKAWLATHPANTEKITVGGEGGLLVEFGFWPPEVYARLKPRAVRVSVFHPPPEGSPAPVLDQEEQIRRNELDYAACREAAKFSVRGWGGPEIAEDRRAKIEKVEVAPGRFFPALSEESLDLLWANDLLLSVGATAIVHNVLTEYQKKMLGQPSDSGSSSPHTPAPDAQPVTPKKTTATSGEGSAK